MVGTCLKKTGFAGVEDEPAENYKFHTSNRSPFLREQRSERKSFDRESGLPYWYITAGIF